MNKHAPALVATLIALAALLPSVADARTVTASQGVPIPLTSANCWDEEKGGMQNTCSSDQSLDINLPVDNAGNHMVNVTALWGVLFSNDPQESSWCQSYGIDAGFTTISDSAKFGATFPGSSTVQTVSPTTSVYVPSGGSLGVVCNMLNKAHNSARLLTINY
jgi:hypothetical protein